MRLSLYDYVRLPRSQTLDRSQKERPGTHTQGIAADIKVNNGAERFILLNYAFEMGFSGIGVAKTFIHVDIRDSQPVSWVY